MTEVPTLDIDTIKRMVTEAVEDQILSAIDSLIKDPNWLKRIEYSINQTVIQETISRIGSTDINTIINQRIDENNERLKKGFKGLTDQATNTQLTITDHTTVVENTLTTKELHIVEGARINNLAVTGSINTDNKVWDILAQNISEKTLANIESTWRDQLVKQVTEQIQEHGVNFTEVRINDESVIDNGKLADFITESNLRQVGTLKDLTVKGKSVLYDTLAVVNGRVGINTDAPEMALSIWDEEVAVNVGKFKENQAYVGTSRAQGLSLGVNRIPQLDISVDGITTIKQLRVGVHMISHAPTVPGYAGTRGDIVFNSSYQDDRVFAWVCLGGHKWQTLKSAE